MNPEAKDIDRAVHANNCMPVIAIIQVDTRPTTSTRLKAEDAGIRFVSDDTFNDAAAWMISNHAKVFKKLAE